MFDAIGHLSDQIFEVLRITECHLTATVISITLVMVLVTFIKI